MSTRRRKFVILGVLLLTAGAAVYFFWPESPQKKVPRLLRELRDIPTGKFQFYFGRTPDQISTDLKRLGKAAVPALIEALQGPDPAIRYLAAGELGRIGDSSAVEPLITSLNDSDFVVQYWAISALGDIGDRRAVDPLLPFLKDNDPGCRFRAAQALGRIGDGRAFDPLLPLLEDPTLYPRAHAVEALANLGERRAFEILLRILESEEDSWVRSEAAAGLGRLADTRAIPALRKAVADDSPQVREAAKDSLTRLKAK